jgi:hypothetical protein
MKQDYEVKIKALDGENKALSDKCDGLQSKVSKLESDLNEKDH